MSGSDISWAICKSAPHSRQITTPSTPPLSFLQAGCPSCHPTNSVKALKATHNIYELYEFWAVTKSKYQLAAGSCSLPDRRRLWGVLLDPRQHDRVPRWRSPQSCLQRQIQTHWTKQSTWPRTVLCEGWCLPTYSQWCMPEKQKFRRG